MFEYDFTVHKNKMEIFLEELKSQFPMYTSHTPADDLEI